MVSTDPVPAGSDRTIAPVIALIVLLLAAGAATRGYLPGVTAGPRQPTAASPAEPLVLVVLLGASMGAVTLAVAHRIRHQRMVAGSAGELSLGAGPHRGRPDWRVLLIALAALAAWLLTIFVLARLGGGHGFGIRAELFGSPGGAPTSPTAPDAPVPVHPSSRPDGSTSEVFGYLLAAAAGLLLLMAAVIVAARARRPAPRSPDAAPVAGPTPTAGETLARAAELGLVRITDRSREPREAIIACYAALERHLAALPAVAPRDFDTPTEVLARAVEHHALPADNASRLVELFIEARFSPHLMTERHRADAVAILRRVLDELRAPT